MGKSYRKDARNDKWRKAKYQKSQKKTNGKPVDDLYDKNFGVLIEPETGFRLSDLL